MPQLKIKIEEVLEKNIAGDEELLNKVKGKCGHIEREINGMLNREDPDLKEIFNRVKTLIKRLLGDIWVEKNWYNIEKDIKRELDSQKR